MVIIPDKFINILKGFVDDLRIDHQSLGFRTDNREYTPLIISTFFSMILFKLCNKWLLIFVSLDQAFKGVMRAQLKLTKLISSNIKPVEDDLVFLFMMVDLFL